MRLNMLSRMMATKFENYIFCLLIGSLIG